MRVVTCDVLKGQPNNLQVYWSVCQTQEFEDWIFPAEKETQENMVTTKEANM